MACVFLYKEKNLVFRTRKELQDYLQQESIATPPYEFMYIQEEENKFIPVPSYLAAQYENATIEQKNIIESLLIRKEAMLNQNPDTYSVLYNNKTYVLNRVSTVKKKDTYYGWQGKDTEDKYEVNREWGNQVDFILTQLLTHNNTELAKKNYYEAYSTPLLSPEALNKSLQLAEDFINKYSKEGVLMTQVFISNIEKAVGGMLDVVVVRPNGSIKIMDLKSSLSSTKDAKYSTPFTNADSTKSASKKESHSFSMSMYKAMMISQGYNVDNIEILPWKLTASDEIVNDLEQEPVITLNTLSEIIENYGKDSNAEPFMLYKYKSEFGKLAERLRKSLYKKMQQAATIQEKRQLKILYDELSSSHDNIEAINRLIDDASIILLGGVKTYDSGKSYKYSPLLQKIISIEEEANPEVALDNLLKFKDTLNLYKPMIDAIKELYFVILQSEVGTVSPTNDGTPMSKLENLGTNIVILEKYLKERLVPLYAKILWSNHQGDFEESSEYNQRIKKLERRIENAKDPINKQKLIEELEQFKKLIITNEKDLLDVLEGAQFEDLNLIDANLGAASMSGNQLVSLFVLNLKNKLEKARQEMLVFSQDAAAIMQETVGTTTDPASHNKGLYKEVLYFEGLDENKNPIYNTRLGFLNPIDWNKFNTALKDMYEKANTLYPEYLTNKEQARARQEFIKVWYATNTESPKGFKIDGVSIMPSAEEIAKDLKDKLDSGYMTPSDYDFTYNQIFDENGNVRLDTNLGKKHRVPTSAYSDTSYIGTTGSRKKYLNFLLKSYIQAQKQFGTYDLPVSSFYLPYIPKNATDQFMSYIKQNGVFNGMINTSKRWAKETFTIDSDRDYTHNENYKVIPLMYSKRIPTSDISLDLLSSILLYKKAASNYEVLKSTQKFSESYIEIIDEIPMQSRSVLGEILTSKATFKEVRGKSNTSKILREFVDRIVYGETGDVSNPELKKMASALTSFIAFTGLGGPMGIIANTANSLQASAMVFIESYGRQVFSTKSWAKSQVNVKKYLATQALSDAMSPVPKSLFGQLALVFDAIQGEFINEVGHKISQTNLKKHLTKDKWFFLQNLGEWNAQYLSLDAILLDTKVSLLNGEIISLKDAYELGSDGRLKFIDNINMDSLGKVEGLVPLKVKNRLAYINKNMHGIYNQMDQPAAKKKWWGTLLLFYRNWFVSGFKRRYKRSAYNEELGDMDEGIYRVFFRSLISETIPMIKSGFGFRNSEEFTEGERAAMRKTSIEILMNILALIMARILVSLAQGAGDDDERYRLLQAAVLTNRMKLELGQFLDPVDMLKLASSPTMALTTILNIVRLMKSLLGDVEGLIYYGLGDEEAGIQRYERDSGLWERGDSKTAAKFFRVFNYSSSRAIWTPEEVIKAQQLREL